MERIELLQPLCKQVAIFITVFLLSTSAALAYCPLVISSDTLKIENKKWKFLFALDSRTSRALEQKTGLGGLKIGATINKKHDVGIGIYFFKNPILRGGVQLPVEVYADATDTTRYNFSYASIFYGPIWYRNKRLTISTPIHYGSAAVTAAYKVKDTIPTVWKNYINRQSAIMEVSCVANYKLLRWFGIGVGGGYRSLLTNDKSVRRALNGPVFIFQAKLMLGVLFKLAIRKPIDDGWNER